VGLLADAFRQDNAEPHYMMVPLRQLPHSTGETVYLRGWRHGELRILATIEGAKAVGVTALGTGDSGAAHARTSGKLSRALPEDDALDAYVATHKLTPLTPRAIVEEADLRVELASIRERGYAIGSEEYAEGVSCVSARIRKGDAAIAAIGLSAPTACSKQIRKRYVQLSSPWRKRPRTHGPKLNPPASRS
jgi:IclR family acetate operon transcriptional repressor